MMRTMTMALARGGSKGRSINDSISEHKCMLTLFTLSLYFTPIHDPVALLPVTRLQVLTELQDSLTSVFQEVKSEKVRR